MAGASRARSQSSSAQRASDGCSRFHPGRHYPVWKYLVDADPDKDGLIKANAQEFAPGAPPSKMSKALDAGIICDDIEVTAGYNRNRPRCDNEMNENPLFAQCYQIRCMQWFGTTKPTDGQSVPDNYMTNQRRIG
eukprot:13190957-Heterocapsa_arctica.AAC.1